MTIENYWLALKGTNLYPYEDIEAAKAVLNAKSSVSPMTPFDLREVGKGYVIISEQNVFDRLGPVRNLKPSALETKD